MATRKRSKRTSKKSGRGRSRGDMNTVVDVPHSSGGSTWPSGGEPRDTIVMPRVGAGVGGGTPVRHRGNLVEINKLLSELQKSMESARKASDIEGLIGWVTHCEKLIAVTKYIAPESFAAVIRGYEKRLLPIAEAMYARCRARRVMLGNT